MLCCSVKCWASFSLNIAPVHSAVWIYNEIVMCHIEIVSTYMLSQWSSLQLCLVIKKLSPAINIMLLQWNNLQLYLIIMKLSPIINIMSWQWNSLQLYDVIMKFSPAINSMLSQWNSLLLQYTTVWHNQNSLHSKRCCLI